jgi:hypothetical protein
MTIAGYTGPAVIISGGWGEKDDEFGFKPQDTADTYPKELKINLFNDIFLADIHNKKVKIYKSDGSIYSIIKPKNVKKIKFGWPSFLECDSQGNIYTSNYDERLQKYNSQGQLLWEKMIYVGSISMHNDDKLIISGYRAERKGKEKFVSYYPNGKLISGYEKKPTELVDIIMKRVGLGDRKYKTLLKYPDHTYEIYSRQPFKKYYRDRLKNLYRIESFSEKRGAEHISSYRVFKYGFCDNKEIIFEMPKSEYEPKPPESVNYPTWKRVPVIEYGEPVISRAGDLYCWARTKTEYRILKWTWQGEPDVPQSLTAKPSATGILLGWKSPVQNTDDITEYEILRSAKICGLYKPLAKVEKNVFQYEDKSVKEKATLYYQVRAIKSSGYSGYSNKVACRAPEGHYGSKK